jgi:dihydroorotate dehydrogenase (fumarate)
VQVVSAILRNGPDYFRVLRRGFEDWMARHEIASLEEMRGRVSLKHIVDPAVFERGNYIRTLHSWSAAQ